MSLGGGDHNTVLQPRQQSETQYQEEEEGKEGEGTGGDRRRNLRLKEVHDLERVIQPRAKGNPVAIINLDFQED